MNCLVVVTHPQEESLCCYLAAETVAFLEAQGHKVVVQNLYEAGFDPRLSRDERQSYYQLRFNVSAVEAEIRQLEAAEMLVLVFPTWWFGFPAILKGWFDRVWAPGHAYDHASDLGAITPRLGNLKHTYAVTTLGSPWWVDYLIMWRPVYRVLRFALLGTCARSSSFKMVSLYKSENVSTARVEKFVSKIKGMF